MVTGEERWCPIAGIGFGLIYLPSIVIVGYWFNKKRALATGIAVCGSSLGGFALVPMCSILLEEYDWRGTTLLLGGFVINAAWAGALFRTFEDADSADTKKELANGGRQNGDVKNSNIMTSVMNEKARQMTDSTHSLDNCVITGIPISRRIYWSNVTHFSYGLVRKKLVLPLSSLLPVLMISGYYLTS